MGSQIEKSPTDSSRTQMPDANTKYLAAWSEVNARLQTRDNVFLAFMSLTSVS